MSENREKESDVEALRASIQRIQSDPRTKLISAILGIWIDYPADAKSTLPDPPSTIIFPDGRIRYRDSEILDLRLEVLFDFGMPRHAPRVIQRYNGEIFGKKYKSYLVDVLSVSLNDVSNPKGDSMQTGGASYYRRNDGLVGLAHHWLRRLSRGCIMH